jgi:16S rRNA G966 N2-methylase RsmD
VGFEALSRGVASLTLVEYNRDCLLAIQKNIESLKPKACNLYPRDAQKTIKKLHEEKKKFDIIFLDPPYFKGKVPRLSASSIESGSGLAAAKVCDSLGKKILQTLSAYDILAPDGFIIVQHFKKDNLPDILGDLSLIKEARYADTVLSFYREISFKKVAVT